MTIPIDFVAGSHGNFLEVVLNRYFNILDAGEVFTNLGTSHCKSQDYQTNKLFSAKHWFELHSQDYMKQFDKIIAIRFSPDDLLLLSSVSLLRAGDMNINDNELEINTRHKLNNQFYCNLVQEIDLAYPFLDSTQSDIPRHVLREFFKFGFRDTDLNGYWLQQSRMQYPLECSVFYFDFESFYDIDKFVRQLQQLEVFLDMQFDFSPDFYQQHQTFLSFIPYVGHKQMCDYIIECVQLARDINIPKLSLFQESYINGNLERIFEREMPFCSIDYFNSTADMLYYIKNQAPEL
jgi:hypothetical protein